MPDQALQQTLRPTEEMRTRLDSEGTIQVEHQRLLLDDVQSLGSPARDVGRPIKVCRQPGVGFIRLCHFRCDESHRAFTFRRKHRWTAWLPAYCMEMSQESDAAPAGRAFCCVVRWSYRDRAQSASWLNVAWSKLFAHRVPYPIPHIYPLAPSITVMHAFHTTQPRPL